MRPFLAAIAAGYLIHGLVGALWAVIIFVLVVDVLGYLLASRTED